MAKKKTKKKNRFVVIVTTNKTVVTTQTRTKHTNTTVSKVPFVEIWGLCSTLMAHSYKPHATLNVDLLSHKRKRLYLLFSRTSLFRDVHFLLNMFSQTKLRKPNNVVADWQTAPGKRVLLLPEVHFLPPWTHSGSLYYIMITWRRHWSEHVMNVPSECSSLGHVVSKCLLSPTHSGVTWGSFICPAGFLVLQKSSVRSSHAGSVRNVSTVISLLHLTYFWQWITGDANHLTSNISVTQNHSARIYNALIKWC